MLSSALTKALNDQIVMEAYASSYYLSLASWCDQKGFPGTAAFFYKQSEEEREHMMKIFMFVNENEGKAISPGVNEPPADFETIGQCFDIALGHEKKVTAAINDIMKLAREENDFRTMNLMQWFVDEQLEEESQMQVIIDKLRLIGDNGVGLYMLDGEMAERAAAKGDEGE